MQVIDCFRKVIPGSGVWEGLGIASQIFEEHKPRTPHIPVAPSIPSPFTREPISKRRTTEVSISYRYQLAMKCFLWPALQDIR